MRRLAALLLLLGSVATASAAEHDPAYEFIDLTDDFARFFDSTQSLAEADRIAAFRKDFVPLFPQFYGPERFTDVPADRYDARIARALARFPSIRGNYTRTAAAFQDMLRPALTTFRNALPGLKSLPTIYLVHSLGEMDGGTRTLDDKLYLIFGADVMASMHRFSDEQPFLHHELFHVYHQQYFAECPQVWCALWTEGLAVYAAKQLNPQADDAQLLLTQPEPIRPQVDKHLRESVCAVASRLDSDRAEDIDALFSFRRLDERVPPRAGYYIGMLVAQQAGTRQSLSELAQLDATAVRRTVQQSLDALAKCE